MGTIKNLNMDIEEFKFGQLIPNDDGHVKDTENFKLKSLNQAQDFKHNISPEKIRREREFESRSSFEILELVKQHRGLQNQADQDYEERVSAEVERRVLALKEQAVKDGFEAGREEGYQQAYKEAQIGFEENLQGFAEQIEHVQNDVKKIFNDSTNSAYLMVKNLTKWIILKEVDEKYYLARLLEKLIHEINSKANLTIHVNEDSFGYMPEIVKIVERKVGKLTNVRVEVDLDMHENGIKLESENNIIDGSLEAQFETIDRLFQNVGLNE